MSNTTKITKIDCPESSGKHQSTPEVIITDTVVKATQGGAAAARKKFEVPRKIKGS